MSNNGAIGKDNTLPWKLGSDLKRFKDLTTGKVILMGRKTHDSIGKPLPNRTNVVVSTRPGKDILTYAVPSLLWESTWDKALAVSRALDVVGEIMVIGGATIYTLALPECDRIYLTTIDIDVPDADTFFPAFNRADFLVTHEEKVTDEKAGLSYIYEILDRIVKV